MSANAGAEIATFPWFDQVPEHLKTRRQLAALGLRPMGGIAGRVVWRRGRRHADLFDARQAVQKRPTTAAQRAALEKAHRARCTCGACGVVFPFVLPRDFECYECARRIAVRTAAEWLADPATALVDFETTDLDGFAVEAAVIDVAGVVLFAARFAPGEPIAEGATAVHGIRDEDVQGEPSFAELAAELRAAITGRRLVSYGGDFEEAVFGRELGRLGAEERAAWPRIRVSCAKEVYALFCGEWNDKRGSWRWQPLPGGDHSAAGDARALLDVVQKMATAGEAAATEERST